MFERILIFGSDGQLAQAIFRSAPALSVCTALNRHEADITDPKEVSGAMDRLAPALVINGAAYNAVDLAEGKGEQAAELINAHGPAVLAAECTKRGTPLVHFSTDLVFDGSQRAAYEESDPTRPLNVYGVTKLAGENAVISASCQNYVIRVCRLFGPPANPAQGTAKKPYGNFPRLMLRLAHEEGRVKVVNDQIGTPTYTPDLAKAIWELVASSSGGLYHLSNAGEVSYSDYAHEIFRLSGVACEVDAVTTEEYGAPAVRPKYSVMDNAKANSAGVAPLRDWRAALAEYLAE
jgi:dTDP-4-dehydrorhamnose reductase